MGKLYTVIASLLTVIEVMDFINLSVLKGHPADPINTIPTYAELSQDVQLAFRFMSNFVGLAKLYMACYLVGTAMSSEPKIRAISSGLACVTTYIGGFVTLTPAMDQVVDSGFASVDTMSLMKIPFGVVLGPLFGLAAYQEYKEWNDTSSSGSKKTN